MCIKGSASQRGEIICFKKVKPKARYGIFFCKALLKKSRTLSAEVFGIGGQRLSFSSRAIKAGHPEAHKPHPIHFVWSTTEFSSLAEISGQATPVAGEFARQDGREDWK